MEWPDFVKIKFQSKYIHNKINKLIVFIVIRARHKNNYTLGPFKTDENGELEISRHAVKELIFSTQEQFPMDYADTLEKCGSEITVEIESKSSLEERWHSINEFYPDEAMKLRQLLDNQSNFISSQTKYYLNIDSKTRVITIEI
jgi:hypothetical protein